MNTSVAESLRRSVASTGPGRFWRYRDFDGSERAIESGFARLVADGELMRVRKGLFWRGEQTRFGMVPPSPLATALEVAGPGSGPASVAAAHFLGLTTQVPGTIEVAAPGRAPAGWRGVRFCARPYERRERALRPLEVAVIELLRDPHAAESPWPTVCEHIAEHVRAGRLRADVLAAEIRDEPHRAARTRWAEVEATL